MCILRYDDQYRQKGSHAFHDQDCIDGEPEYSIAIYLKIGPAKQDREHYNQVSQENVGLVIRQCNQLGLVLAGRA